MTIFDLIAFAVVVWSAIAGSQRGVVSELFGLFAMALSAMATIACLPFTAPIARHFIHAGWMSAVAAAVVTFIVVFLFLRALSSMLTQSINRSMLSGANRFGGLMFGGLRGLVFLALFALLFNKVTPQAMKPTWITGAATYPLATAGAQALQAILPKKFDPTGGFGQKLTQSIDEQSGNSSPDQTPASETASPELQPSDAPPPQPSTSGHNPPSSERAKPAHNGYTKHARDSVDALVERSK